jgi:Flp pilus assembly protein TadG
MSSASNRRQPGRLDQRGIASLEFAVVAGAFFTMLTGGMEIGRYLIIVDSLRTVAAEAARAKLISSNGGTAYNQSNVMEIAPALDSSKISLSAGSCTNHVISVTASYPFTSALPFWTSMNGTLSDTTQIYC